MSPRRRGPAENPLSHYDVRLTWIPNEPGFVGRSVWERIRELDLHDLYVLRGIKFLIDGMSPVMRVTYTVTSGVEASPTFAELAGEGIRRAAIEVMPTFVKEEE